MKYPFVRLIFLTTIFLSLTAQGEEPPATLLRAFPGAEGFGAATPGGRGGKILFVTTLDDYLPDKEEKIPGSLRAAVSEKGPRYILFRVGGTIALKADLVIGEPFVTIAGQSAPGDGICIKDYQVVLGTHDVILRHIRLRSGDETRKEQMALGIFGGNNSIVDHCSMSWAIDEVMSSFGTVHNLTVQWSIIAEGLSRSYHPKGEHSKGSILNGDGGITLHHSIYAHNASRNPRVDCVVLDWRNNVTYDWGYVCAYTSSGPAFVNWRGNYFKPGPSTRSAARKRLFSPADDMLRIFLEGNLLDGAPECTEDFRKVIAQPKNAPEGFDISNLIVDKPFPCPYVVTQSAMEAYELVLQNAGATLPRRDAADERLIHEIRSGTGRIIDSPQNVGGWPKLAAGTPKQDSDDDGMPDEWESANNLNPRDSADALLDADNDGYPNLEEFLNGTSAHDPEQNCYLDAGLFVKTQQEATDIAAHAMEAFVEWKEKAAQKRQAIKEEIIKTLPVVWETDDQGNHGTLKLGDTTTMEFVRIPAGSFLMGSPDDEGGLENERPQHRVTISRSFFMAATPTTVAQYRAVYGKYTPSKIGEEPEFPVREVSWYDAVEFCDILSAVTGRTFRLPTEAEWEYACRAGTSTAFYTGDTISTDQANFNGEEATRYNPAGVNRATLTPVKMFPPNPWGLYDMPGNEAEWCRDSCFRTYTAAEVIDPFYDAGPDSARVLRGGKATSKAFFLRSAYRYGYTPSVGYGFRVVLEDDQPTTK
ncbi:MAG TPA: SUMF1/EgtB/PvdO family nonheme iron enzyme [Candidatus Hydrogenedentes bacterium]|nr:SUMF1/EgtB/PvdO family nonheme iron enzyme [Candidatus Hydrogenedentota bacterium]HOL76975.1 SUMF1/EgtB/PvdO family nonheme iron enzyme [Candidatus Hydrogenedentota bacterium]HPO86635.1 SUMF1/EgtB/PvdO family nonheme iron enzyme [Candidatus Hydrogenedentota bacterium]